jgi:hypothetical protein
MPDAVLIDFGTDMTPELYDQINERVNPHGSKPPGLLFHCAGPSPDGGWRIVDVWDSRATFDAFMQTMVMPAAAEFLGLEAVAEAPPPRIESWPLHNLEK